MAAATLRPPAASDRRQRTRGRCRDPAGRANVRARLFDRYWVTRDRSGICRAAAGQSVRRADGRHVPHLQRSEHGHGRRGMNAIASTDPQRCGTPLRETRSPRPAHGRDSVATNAGAPAGRSLSESAGINRHGEGDEGALHRRTSDPRWPRVMRWCPVRAQRSVDRGARRPAIEPRKGRCLGCRRRRKRRKATSLAAFSRAVSGPRVVGEPVHACDLSMRENREVPRSPACGDGRAGRAGKASAVIP